VDCRDHSLNERSHSQNLAFSSHLIYAGVVTQKWIVPILLIVVVAFLTNRPGQRGSLFTKVSGPAPHWVMNDLEGKPVHATNFLGRVVLVNFWATWCPPCRTELPEFVEFTKRHDTNRVIIIGASADEGGPQVVKPFVTSYKLNFPILMADAAAMEQFGGVPGFPTTFIIDTNGMFASRHLGPMSKADFKRFVDPLLGLRD
jgi:cytochrome c biogenesis protein CcmG/thiol:disulfide interchange protein DsbE